MNQSVVVNDAMVLIHLAKITLLETCCGFFKRVLIPEAVFDEAVKAGKKQKYADAAVIEEVIGRGKITVKKVEDKNRIARLGNYNITGGEAEAIALYWQEGAELLACDDDNVRKKQKMLDVNLVGTPAIILALYKSKMIDAKKVKSSVEALREIGWFGSTVLDKIIMEV